MPKRLIGVLLVLALATMAPLFAQAPQGRRLQITFDMQGNVTLVAQNVTVREILAEWARQGGSKFVNAERLAGGPVSLQFENRPEREVVESLLRQAAGYVLGPRRAGNPGASRFEVVYILPTSNPTTSAYTPSAPSAPVQAPLRTSGSPDDEIPPVTPPTGPVDPRNPQNPPPASTDPSANRPGPSPGVSGVAVPVVPIVPVGAGTTTGRGGGGAAPPAPTGGVPTGTPPGTGRGGGGGLFR